MKNYFIVLIIILCVTLCACKNEQMPTGEGSGNSAPAHDLIPSESGEESGKEDSQNTQSQDETSDVTLPSQWGNIELPDDVLDNPTTSPSETKPSPTEPPVTNPSSAPEEDPVPTAAPTEDGSGGPIELPEDVFN